MVREEAFDVLDVDAAYWLGFLFADGSISLKPRWALSLHLGHQDLSHVQAFHLFIGGTIGHTITGARLTACSKRLVSRLTDLGLVASKEIRSGEPPVLEDDLCRAFLRGLFDGDGCLHVTRRQHAVAAFCGRPELVAWVINQIGIPVNGLLVRNGTAYATWSSGPRARAIAAYLYSGDGPALGRKRAIAQSEVFA
jgi:hypothetical protein